MGNRHSKKVRTHQLLDNRVNGQASDMGFMMENENDGGAISQKTYDEGEVHKLRKELTETPHVFVLNNLLMSVMFFENFEKEKQRLVHSSRTTMERELNPTLLRDETIECVIPDVIFETVNKNVQFRASHGPRKDTPQPLVQKRLFVVNDNIEVLESKHTPQYSAIDKPSYQVVVEESENKGYVKLKCAPSQARQISKTDNEPIEIEPAAGPSTKPDDSDFYDYSTITNVNTPKPLNITSCERRDTLPKTCFSMRRIKKFEENEDNSDEEKEEENPENEKDMYEMVSYISSHGFMTYFESAVFPNSLGRALGFGYDAISLATSIPGKIFCNLQDVDDNFPLLPCQIVPSVAVQWPIQTYEFHQRGERMTMWDKFGVEYRWPLEWMINDIRGLNAVLIPRGCIPKKGKNLDSEIEWDFAFPKAERYLDTHMIHPQVRAFLFLLTFHKAYIEPITKHQGLLVDHIRTHMYWECESNPRDWPEHRLGTRLISVMRNLMQALSVGRLSDFFIKDNNLFANVPNKYLQHAHRLFHNALESPALYFLGALRNLKYTNPKFYPSLNFKHLYKILTTDSGQRAIGSSQIRPPNLNPKIRRPAVDGDANYRKEVHWKAKKELQNREKILHKRKETKDRQENLNTQRRASIDSVDLEYKCDQNFDTFKKREILFFFIKHFLEMARKSRRLATQRQALFYLKQAYYLAKILFDVGLEAEGRDFLEIIRKEEETSQKLSVSEQYELAPSTPKRNSLQFNWELTQQQVKGNNINLHNLNMSYNSTAVAPPAFNNLKRHPSNLKTRTSIATPRGVVGFSDTVEIR